jgi:glutathione S-transferase
MAAPVRIIGSYISPYVRKVLVCLRTKGVPYEIDPIIPFVGDDRFSQLSPLRRIPVYTDGHVTLTDSSVICQYLEDRHPEPTFYPRDVADRARARWIEEYADTRIGDVFIWRLFFQVKIRPLVLGQAPDDVLVAKNLAEDVPQVLDYLEGLAPTDGFLFGALSIADVAIACFFRNAALARFNVDGARWPRTHGLLGRVLAIDGFQHTKSYEDMLLRTPPAEHRAVLADMGAPLTRDTFGTTTLRAGVMSP